MSDINLSIDYQKMNIENCFKNHYVVPDYQREYVWDETQVEQLLSDINEAYVSNNKKPYFLGMTVVYQGNDSDLELIDGQQRITTFFLILCVLINLYEKNNESSSVFKNIIYSPKMDFDGNTVDSYCLDLQYESSSKQLDNIFKGNVPEESSGDDQDWTLSEKRLYAAYRSIKKKLIQDYPKIDELKRFGSYIFKMVQFVQIETNDIADALKIFETINQRGVGLNSMDLLKNMMFMQVDRDEFKQLNSEWKSIIDKLESIKEKPLRFLRYYITAKYDISDDKGNINGILPEDKIYQWLMNNEAQCGYKKNPFGFVGSMKDAINRYIRFLRPTVSTPGASYLRNVFLIAGTSYRLHMVMLLAAQNMDNDTLEKYHQIVESFVYFATINKVKANVLEKNVAIWCPLIRKIENKDDLKKFVINNLKPLIDDWNNDYQYNFMSLNLNSIQKYRINFILARIGKYVNERKAGGSNYADVTDFLDKKYTLEHIMPQTCNDLQSYDMTAEEYDEYIGRLGNLTILEKTINSCIQNALYEEKKGKYELSDYYLTKTISKIVPTGKNTSADRVNKLLRSWTSWDKNSINDRQKLLYELSLDIFKIDKIISDWG